MLFLIGIALVMLALSLSGQGFEASLSLAIAALTNTGPAAQVLDPGLSYAQLGDAARLVLCAAMIVGRLEALVVVALLNPEFWRQ